MPPAYVKRYVKRQKNDMADAEAICEAVARTNMRFAPTKSPEQQSCLMLHRTRHLFIRQQTAVINPIRAHLAEFGVVAPVGRKGVTELLHIVAEPSHKRVSEVARACLAALGGQLQYHQPGKNGDRLGSIANHITRLNSLLLAKRSLLLLLRWPPAQNRSGARVMLDGSILQTFPEGPEL